MFSLSGAVRGLSVEREIRSRKDDRRGETYVLHPLGLASWPLSLFKEVDVDVEKKI